MASGIQDYEGYALEFDACLDEYTQHCSDVRGASWQCNVKFVGKHDRANERRDVPTSLVTCAAPSRGAIRCALRLGDVSLGVALYGQIFFSPKPSFSV